jgi:hypothetical protein
MGSGKRPPRQKVETNVPTLAQSNGKHTEIEEKPQV